PAHVLIGHGAVAIEVRCHSCYGSPTAIWRPDMIDTDSKCVGLAIWALSWWFSLPKAWKGWKPCAIVEGDEGGGAGAAGPICEMCGCAWNDGHGHGRGKCS